MATGEIECSICQEDVKDRRLLPCIHSFCLECLRRYCREKQPGDVATCPLCRYEFKIPLDGVTGLPSSTARVQDPFSTFTQDGARYCNVHEDEKLRIYCFDCSMTICAMCCLEDHIAHNFKEIGKALGHISKDIDDKVEQMTSCIDNFRGVAAHLEAEKYKALDNIQAMETEVQKRCEKMKQMIDRQANKLLQGLNLQESATEQDVRSYKRRLQRAVTEMISLRSSTSELMSTGLPCDITQAANDMHQRAQQLLQTYANCSEYHSPSYKFIPLDIDDRQNFVGHVVERSV